MQAGTHAPIRRALALALGGIAVTLITACATRRPANLDATPVADAREFVVMQLKSVDVPADEPRQWMVDVKVVQNDRDGPLPAYESAKPLGVDQGVWDAGSTTFERLFAEAPHVTTRTLQAPTLLVLDGQEGTVFIGELNEATVETPRDDVSATMDHTSTRVRAESVHAGTELSVTPTASDRGGVNTNVSYRRWMHGRLTREVPGTNLRMTPGRTYIFEAVRVVQE